MPYINPRNRQKGCIRKHKLVAIHTFTIPPDFGGTVSNLGLCPTHFGKNPAKNRRQIPCAHTLFSCFFARLLIFGDKIKKSVTDLKINTFFLEHT